jgi:hypothetical protein
MSRKKETDAAAIALRKLLPSCSVCKAAIDSHHFAVVGTTVIGDPEEPRVTQFLRHVKRREWSDLRRFKDWQADRDNLPTYSISCPNGGGMVVVVRSPFELYDSDEVYLQETITPDEQRLISEAVPPGEWQAL